MKQMELFLSLWEIDWILFQSSLIIIPFRYFLKQRGISGSQFHILWMQLKGVVFIIQVEIIVNNLIKDHCMFQENFQRQMVMEWEDAYVNYQALKPFHQILQETYNNYHERAFVQNEEKDVYHHVPEENITKLQSASQKIMQILEKGKHKYEKFYSFKKAQILYHCQELELIIVELSKEEIITHEHCLKRHEIKEIIKIIYLECAYLKRFLELNHKIQRRLKQIKLNCIDPFLKSQKLSFPISRDQSLNFSEISEPEIKEEDQDFIANLEERVKGLYGELVFYDQKKTHRLGALTSFNDKKTSTKSYCLVGLYSGIAIIAVITTILLLALNLVNLDDMDGIDSMVYVFPMFRGVGLLIFYLWGTAWNTYGFQKYRINYRLILEYGPHYSTTMSIMKRASFFTLLLFLMLLVYFLGLTYNLNKEESQPRFNVEYTPFFVWLIYLGYIFFPNRDVFNPQGRKYFYRVLKEVFLSPCFKMSFLISWITDQSVSFVVPIKDLSYTLCFYISNTGSNNEADITQCAKASGLEGFLVAYFIALVPLLLRMAQCYRQAVQDTGKFIGHVQMWNFGKYLASVITATFSYIKTSVESESHLFLIIFIISSLFSTFYAYYWDLKHDWGLLEKNQNHKFLRKKICYRNPKLYYGAIILNLILRFSWTITIAPFILTLIKSPLVPFTVGFIEIFRRCMWNFFRVEKEQIGNIKKYQATKNISKFFNQIDMEKEALPAKRTMSESELIPYFYFFAINKSLIPAGIHVPTEEEVQQYKEKFEKKKAQEEQLFN